MSNLSLVPRPRAAIPDLTHQPRQLLFFSPLNTPLHNFLQELHAVVCAAPEVLEHIEVDLDHHAKQKKLLRLADAEFLANQTAALPQLQVSAPPRTLDEVELATGRPRLEAYVVYLFLLLRGFNGGCKDQQARLLLEESITLRCWLEPLGLRLPPASTLSENLNAVSNQTRRLLHQRQLQHLLGAGLDDFQKCFIDSTAVAANTARPTDSTLLVKLVQRICAAGCQLSRWGLPNLAQVGLSRQQEELRRLSQQILFLNGKARGEGKRRRLYFQLLRRVRRLRKRLLRDYEVVRAHCAARTVPRALCRAHRSAAEPAWTGRRGARPHRRRPACPGAGGGGLRAPRPAGRKSADGRKDRQPER